MKQAQKLYLDLIKENCGEHIYNDLIDHYEHWDAALMTRTDPLVILRDLPQSNNVDTLYIRLSPHSNYTDNPLYQLAESTWGAYQTEIVGYGIEDKGAVISYWWD